MIYLLDTHILLWSLFEPKKISQPILSILQSENDSKLVSGVNLWEISLKYSLGKLELGGSTPEEVFETLETAGYELIDLDNQLLATYYKLPKKADHRDPFDRLLIWQAIANNYSLLTQDQKFQQYGDDGLQVVWGIG